MEHREYRKQARERTATLYGGIAAAAGGLDAYAEAGAFDTVYDAVTGLAGLEGVLAATPGHSVAIAGGLVAVGAARLGAARRCSSAALRRRIMHGDGWMSMSDLREHTGLLAATRSARQTRPGLSWSQRHNPRRPAELGAKLGTLLSGKAPARGRTVVSNFEHGLLVLGEPGSWKSAFLANQVLDHPGPCVVTSTKTEFWDATSEVREHQRGPVTVFDPYAEVPHAAEYNLRFNIVAGCRDSVVAQRRACALMDASAGEGVKSADFWAGRGRSLMTGLLIAADCEGKTLRDVATWLQREDYDEPLEILRHWQRTYEIADQVIGAIEQMSAGGSGAKAASGSAAQTAAQVLEFLAHPRLAAALCPDEGGRAFDFDAFLDSPGTLYLVTGESPTLAPIVSAIAAELRDAVERRVREAGKRCDPPLGLIYDEASVTVPSVPVHQHAATLRGLGVWHCVAVQNYAQIVEKWGAEQAKTMRASLQTHLVLAANDKDDREYYSARIGKRTEQHVSESQSIPDTVKHRIGGNPLRLGRSVSLGRQEREVEVFPATAFSMLQPGQGVVIPPRGHAGIVSITHGMIRANRLTTAVRADREVQARQAEAQRTPIPDVEAAPEKGLEA